MTLVSSPHRGGWRGCVFGLAIAGLLAARTELCVAQLPGLDLTSRPTADSTRLTVRPREMATGTRTGESGTHRLDSLPDYLLSVPQQCVGTRRCPLFIALPGGGDGSRQVTDWFRPVADKYGMILLAPTRTNQGPPLYGLGAFGTGRDKRHFDAALTQILRTYAIDPSKIAIIGRCTSGYDSMILGIGNLDVFSRIASISGSTPTAGMDPQNKTVEFLIDRGFPEARGTFATAQALRRDGHPVKVVFGLRGHEHQIEDYDFLGHWLQESWTTPDPAARTAPSVVADPVPALSTEVLTQMTTFWTSFSQEPDSIYTTARRAHLHEVVVPVAAERPSVWMVDMPALAARYPSVAAHLKKAGLTARQHDAYRVALLSAQIMKLVGNEAGTVEATSVLARNVAFMETHPQEFKALAEAGIAHPDKVQQLRATAVIQHPDLVKEIGPMGIWRTP